MQKFKTFHIHKAQFDRQALTISLSYSFDTSPYFTELIELDPCFNIRDDLDESIIESLLFHISIAFGISYYKLCPTKNIYVESAKIDEIQKKYWKEFYISGLGEFFYRNNIDFRDLCNFEPLGSIVYSKRDFNLSEKTLLPIGGGKDSIVSAHLFQMEGLNNITPFIFGKSDTIKNDFLKIYGKQALVIKRTLDKKLFEMNTQGYYNGHVPITGLISFFMNLVCYMYDYKYIAFSNEKSADIGNTHFHDNAVNHQYSKSTDFEQGFSQYISQYISSEIQYYSKLRDLYEIQIAQIFANNSKEYFQVFSSCNKNFSITKKQDSRWCNSCPKCLFVYIILRPFLSIDETFQIFGEELYEKSELKELFLEVIGETGIKPFECVGEEDEARLGCYFALEVFHSENIPALLKLFKELNSKKNLKQETQNLRKKYNM